MTNQWFEAKRLERRWAVIRHPLARRGTNLTQLAVANQLSNLRTAARKPFPAAESAITLALGVTVEALFPERYGVIWSERAQNTFDELLDHLGGVTAAQAGMKGFGIHVAQWETRPVDLADCPGSEPERLRWIKSSLRRRQFVLEPLAHYAGARRRALDGLGKTPHVELQRMIARCLGVAPKALWPERYQKDGEAIVKGSDAAEQPERTIEEYDRLSLRTGLWLPLRDLVGLPGLQGRFTAMRRHAIAQRWVLRSRFEVTEVLFSSLPAETKVHLLSLSSDPEIEKRLTLVHPPELVSLSCAHMAESLFAEVKSADGGVHLSLSDGSGATYNIRICRTAIPALAVALLGQASDGAEVPDSQS